MVRSRTVASQAFLLVFLLWAAANALSYFVRSDGWGDLLGQSPQNAQALGFPWLIWSEGGSYGSVNYFALLGSVATALLAAGMAYGIAAALATHDAIPVSGSEPAASQPGRALQFQLRTLLGLFVCWVPQCVLLATLIMALRCRPAFLRTPQRN